MRRHLRAIARKDTYNVVVLAADGGCVAQALANTDHGDGRAVKANGHIRVDIDADEVEDLGDGSSGASLFQVLQNMVSSKELVTLQLGSECSTEGGQWSRRHQWQQQGSQLRM